MLLIVSKLIAECIYPIGLFCIGAVCGIVLMRFGRKKLAFYCFFSSILIIMVFANPCVAYLLVRSLESKYNPPSSFPQVSAIVVLGGGTQPPVPPRKYCETNMFGDRIFHALRLAKAHYAPYIICTGGKIKFLHDYPGSEAMCMAQLLREFGDIDSASLIIEDKARNTHDHGPRVREILEKRGLAKDIILVTSAMHMFRSIKVFQKAGFIVHPAPTDYWVESEGRIKLFDLLPDADALFFSTTALHEYYGLLAYWILGWL
jgi:uncharacterized SAM-binding protein YcdF (DUF218 family)